jgi:hypothetical protein
MGNQAHALASGRNRASIWQTGLSLACEEGTSWPPRPERARGFGPACRRAGARSPKGVARWGEPVAPRRGSGRGPKGREGRIPAKVCPMPLADDLRVVQFSSEGLPSRSLYAAKRCSHFSFIVTQAA